MKSYTSLVKFKSIKDWLDNLELQQYNDLFQRYHGFEELVKLTESDFKKLGVKNASDRARIMSSLAVMMQKRNKSFRKKNVEKNLQLEKLKKESTTPQSLFKLVFYSNKTLVGPIGFVPSLNSPMLQDLEKNPWFHGMLTRTEAESKLLKPGDFLIRNSLSHPGDIILSVSMKDHSIGHIKIQSFEQHKFRYYKFDNEAFMSIPLLIKYYMENQKTIQSHRPDVFIINPISCDNKNTTVNNNNNNNIDTESHGSYDNASMKYSEKLDSKARKWTGSQPLLSLDDHCDSGTDQITGPVMDRCPSLPHLSRSFIKSADVDGKFSFKMPMNKPMMLSNADKTDKSVMDNNNDDSNAAGDSVHLFVTDNDSNANNWKRQISSSKCSPFIESETEKQLKPDDKISSLTEPSSARKDSPIISPSVVHAPPKPSRVPTLKVHNSAITGRPVIKIRNITLYEDKDELDDDHDDDDDCVRNSSGKVQNDDKGVLADVGGDKSNNNLGMGGNQLITGDVKPLNSDITLKIRELIFANNPKIISRHITLIDLKLMKLTPFPDPNLGLISGLELLTLPQGSDLRQGLIERHLTLKLFVGTTILVNPLVEDRCNMLSHWLNVAFELKINAGNLFGFFSVMEALCSSQVVRQKNVWKQLKIFHPSSFELFEAKLLPSYKGLLDGSAIILPYQKDTLLPHVSPLLEILERTFIPSKTAAPKLCSWEMNQSLFGLDVILIHLDTARLIMQRLSLYLVASEKFCNGITEEIPALMDLLNPKTQGLYLWGTKGVLVDCCERVPKFESLLTILSEKYD